MKVLSLGMNQITDIRIRFSYGRVHVVFKRKEAQIYTYGLYRRGQQ
jgi:hypothetical protein